MKEDPYDQGDDVRLFATYYNSVGGEIDPTSGYVRILRPDGVTDEIDLGSLVDTIDVGGPHPSVGFYRHIYSIPVGPWGVYRVTWHGEGAFAINEQDRFTVRKTMEQEGNP